MLLSRWAWLGDMALRVNFYIEEDESLGLTDITKEGMVFQTT